MRGEQRSLVTRTHSSWCTCFTAFTRAFESALLDPASLPRPRRTAHPQVSTRKSSRTIIITTEVLLGPFIWGNEPLGMHISKFSVIPKGHTPGQWRLITDLSSPKGRSVNDGIAPALCSLHYITVDQIAAVAATLGHGALIAKLDVESAYRIVRPVLGVQWDGATYVNTMLPFGLRSAPKIFTAIADALQWILRHRHVRFVCHYIDEFIFCGQPGSTECANTLTIALATCRDCVYSYLHTR